jgi:hypothetical protein
MLFFRQPGKVKHELVTAVISGCEGWEEIEDFGNE